jgi:hypothetical protein
LDISMQLSLKALLPLHDSILDTHRRKSALSKIVICVDFALKWPVRQLH